MTAAVTTGCATWASRLARAAAASACCAVAGTGVRGVAMASLAVSAACTTAAPLPMAVAAAWALPRANWTCSAAWAAISSACSGNTTGVAGCCVAATASEPASAWAAVCTALSMAEAAASSALPAASPEVLPPDAGVLTPLLLAGRASADGLGRCWASTSENDGPFLVEAAADLAPSVSAIETGAAGAMAGVGRGAVISGFLWAINAFRPGAGPGGRSIRRWRAARGAIPPRPGRAIHAAPGRRTS